MPRRTDIERILLLGSGPIVIGQACEFDYSGTQACKALREEGYKVILVNSNPATIMTDPDSAYRVYVEPLTKEYIEKIIEIEKPQALIPTLGGQTALNAAMELAKNGILQKHRVELLGANTDAIERAEDRQKFKDTVKRIGAEVPRSFTVHSLAEGEKAANELGFPLVLRPSFTLGGSGGGIAHDQHQFGQMLAAGLRESPTNEVLVEESVLGWKEFELEVMRDHRGTFVVICSIENFDPMGVHTGDSITVAPALTLTDRQYQEMRDEAKRIIEAIGVATGGANIQFAVHPETGRRIVIEMNPRVSRSSALASKATGFPIAKIAAKLAVGYELSEILNDITRSTPSCFEPSIDYIVTKIPRFNFEKFPGARDELTTQMKSVGEVMGIGRTFKESFQKALASLETGTGGLGEVTLNEELIKTPNSQRVFHIAQALREGASLEKLHQLSNITPWFLRQLGELVQVETRLTPECLGKKTELLSLKQLGFTDKRIAKILGINPSSVREARKKLGIRPGYWSVDTCAGEFESHTPYFYSTYQTSASEPLRVTDAVVVLGSGPNRIGQGIEFDYGCVQGIRALRERGHKAVMINSNPETVSTDYDTSDYLFFEPLTDEHVLEVLDFVSAAGVCVQLGGQTPINMARAIEKAGFKILGSQTDAIEGAEDRKKFAEVCGKLDLRVPQNRTAINSQEALTCSREIGFPIICRPSFVLGGRKMEVIDNEVELQDYLSRNKDVMSADSPLLVDEFLENALEVDVDLISDGENVLIGGIVEHIEGAGVHSGDSMGVLPPQRLSRVTMSEIENLSRRLALSLKVIGHLNLQLAIRNDVVYVLEANPRSSRSVPFVSKATGIPLVKLAIGCMLGERLHVTQFWRNVTDIAVKGVVFPFKKFSGSDVLLGPEMKSTGESMGRSSGPSAEYSEALEKAFISAGTEIPESGKVFMSIKDVDKKSAATLARILVSCGYELVATGGTVAFLSAHGLNVKRVNKVREGKPHCVDLIQSGAVKLVINTTAGAKSIADSYSIRRSCVERNIPCLTELSAAQAFVEVLRTRSLGTSRAVRVSPLTSGLFP